MTKGIGGATEAMPRCRCKPMENDRLRQESEAIQWRNGRHADDEDVALSTPHGTLRKLFMISFLLCLTPRMAARYRSLVACSFWRPAPRLQPFHFRLPGGAEMGFQHLSGACSCGAIHDFYRLHSLGHGPCDLGCLAGGRPGGFRAGKAVQKTASQTRARRVGLLHLFRFLDGIGSVDPLVVHLPPRLDMVRLLDGANCVLAGHGQIEIAELITE